jgi:hypothetical protein
MMAMCHMLISPWKKLDSTFHNLIGLDEATFISIQLKNKLIVIHLLKVIQIYGSFFLT